MTRDEKFSMRMPADLKAALQRRADSEDRSLASYVTRVLQAHVEKLARPGDDDPPIVEMRKGSRAPIVRAVARKRAKA